MEGVCDAGRVVVIVVKVRVTSIIIVKIHLSSEFPPLIYPLIVDSNF
jgi:hypothetical protein